MWRGQQTLGDAWARLQATADTLRRHLPLLGGWMIVMAGVGLIYLATVKPDFIASTQLVLQPKVLAQDGPDLLRQYHQFSLDGQQAESELTMLRSERLLRSVFDALQLADAAELRGAHGGFWSGLSGLIHRLATESVGTDDRAWTFGAFTSRISSRRLGLSYVVEVAYRAEDPAVAVRVANAVASAYVRERMTTSIASSRIGIPYLRSRVSAMFAEQFAATDALGRGLVPAADLPDSDVRILGSAVRPLSKSYPRAGPVMLLCLGFGGVSGLLLVVALERMGTTIQSRRHLLQRTGLDCLGEVATGPARPRGRTRRRRSPPAVAEGFKAAYAALLAAGEGASPATIAIVAWRQGPSSRVATGLVELLAANHLRAALIDLDRPEQSVAADRLKTLLEAPPARTTLVVALPSLDRTPEARGLLAVFAARIVVVEARRTTLTQIRAVLSTFRSAATSLTGVIVEVRPPN